jgi:predicted DNA binding CopG/RHH family protein
VTKARFPDPYEDMSDEELDRHFASVLISHRQRQQAISIRFPEDLLAEIRELAHEIGIGYQTLIKNLLERDVAQLRVRRTGRRRPATARTAATARRTSHKRAQSPKRAVRSSAKTPAKRTKTRPQVPA